MKLLQQLALRIALLSNALIAVSAHGDHGHQVPIAPPDADWATRHMAEEHHLNGWDADTFFTLHDFKSSGVWTPSDIRRMYGLAHKSSDSVDEEHKRIAIQHILDFYDTDKSGDISRNEFLDGWMHRGVRLPDLGFGPGHHGDEEYEYEIHHFEKYHGADTKEEDLKHPEDIEHFREEMRREKEEEYYAGHAVIEANIPKKFLRT